MIRLLNFSPRFQVFSGRNEENIKVNLGKKKSLTIGCRAAVGIQPCILKLQRFWWYFQLCWSGPAVISDSFSQPSSHISTPTLPPSSRAPWESGGLWLTDWPGRRGWAMEGSHIGRDRCVSDWTVPCIDPLTRMEPTFNWVWTVDHLLIHSEFKTHTLEIQSCFQPQKHIELFCLCARFLCLCLCLNMYASWLYACERQQGKGHAADQCVCVNTSDWVMRLQQRMPAAP